MKLAQYFAKVKRTIMKHSPIILTTTGIVGVGATAYLTYKAAPRVENIVRIAKEPENDISRKDTAIELIHALAPPVSMGVFSIGCFIWSYNIQAGRISVLSGALATSISEMNNVKERYLEQYGEEEHDKFFGPTREFAVITQDEKGKDIESMELEKDNYSLKNGVWFDCSGEYTSDDHEYNLSWVESQISGLELKIFQRGHLLMNEVLDVLGMERTRAGALLGWNVNAGFRVQVFHMWNETTQFREPQIFISWDTPKYVYDTIEFDDTYYH